MYAIWHIESCEDNNGITYLLAKSNSAVNQCSNVWVIITELEQEYNRVVNI